MNVFKICFKYMFINMLSVQWAMGSPNPPFLPCLMGQPGTQKDPRARAWARGQARRPVRHGPQGTTCPLGPLGYMPGQPSVVPGRPARCPGGHLGTHRRTFLTVLLQLAERLLPAVFGYLRNLSSV